jgi:hypothetical protein
MPEPKRARAEADLDDVSDHLGVVLHHADELLAQWSAFGAAVRGQVQREAAAIGEAVAGAVDTAVARATASGIDRAITDQVGSHLTALTAEIARLEARTRAAARAVAGERTGDRRLLWIVIGGIVLANALLVAILLQRPTAVPAPAAPTKVELAAPPAPPPEPATAATSGSADEPQVDAPSSNELPVPVKENAMQPAPGSAVPGSGPAGSPASGAPTPGVSGAPAKSGAPALGASGAPAKSGAPAPGVSGAPAKSGAPVRVLGASAPGVRVAPAAKLPPRVPLQKK